MVPNCGICSIMKPKDWKNLGIQRKSNVEEITIDEMMKSTYMDIPTGEECKLNIAKELCDVKNGHLDIDNLNKAEANTILENILTSF